MPTRNVKQYSDRGSIKNLVSVTQDIKDDISLSPSEERLKKLFEYSKLHKDDKMLAALGFITTDYIADKNALPLSVYRLRQIVSDISSRPDSKVSQIKKQLDEYFTSNLSEGVIASLNSKKIKKIGSLYRPSFWRVKS